jgi:hypothetical protein
MRERANYFPVGCVNRKRGRQCRNNERLGIRFELELLSLFAELAAQSKMYSVQSGRLSMNLVLLRSLNRTRMGVPSIIASNGKTY